MAAPENLTRFENLHLEIDGPVARLVMASAPVNAVGSDLSECLMAALELVEANPGISVLRIASALRVFSAGAELTEVSSILNSDCPSSGMRDFVEVLHKVNQRIEDLNAITIAEINGAAIGGGLEMALACDFRLATPKASVGLPETALGIIPGAGGTQRLRDLAGKSIARRLIYTCEIIDAKTALAHGILDRVFEADEFEEAASVFAFGIAKQPACALAAAKRCLAQDRPDGMDTEIAEISKLAADPGPRARIEGFLKR